MFSYGLSSFSMFSDCFPSVEILFKIIYEGSSVVLRMISDDFRCFPMFSAVFRCFPTVFRLFSDDVFWLLKSSSSWSKLSMMGPQLFSEWYQMVLDFFRCFPTVFRMFSDCFPTVFRLFSDNVFRLLKSSSSWTKLSMMGPQLFSGWYQMILDVFRCSQQFSDVFRLFSDCFLTMFSDCWNPLQPELNYLWTVLSCSQDDIRWFKMFSDVLSCFPMFSAGL